MDRVIEVQKYIDSVTSNLSETDRKHGYVYLYGVSQLSSFA